MAPGLSRSISRKMFSRLVSGSRKTFFAVTARRSPRSLIWRSDSSPETYSTSVPASLNLSATCSSSVLLPMPGSPPISTSVPGTMPPPRTRSNSVTPDGRRRSSCGSISVNATALTSRSLNPLLPRRDGCVFSSTNEFHSPHSGHLPSHLPERCPQLWQANNVSAFFTGINRILQQLFHILGRAAEDCAVAAFHDRPLQQVRVFDHQRNQLTVVELAFAESQLFINRFTLAQKLTRFQVQLSHEFGELLLAQGLNVVIHLLKCNATLPEQLVHFATLRSSRFFVDRDFVSHRLRENPPHARCFSYPTHRENVRASSHVRVVTLRRLVHRIEGGVDRLF